MRVLNYALDSDAEINIGIKPGSIQFPISSGVKAEEIFS